MVAVVYDDEVRHSPIRNRIGLLEYHSAVQCHYGRKAALWVSWNDDNPRRRYLKCFKAREGGCNFHGWYEGLVDPFMATLLVDLRNEVWMMKKQRMFMKQTVKEAIEKIEEQEKEVAELEEKVAELKEEVARLDPFEGEEYLEGKVCKLELEKKLLAAVCVVLLSVAMFMHL
ncbi:hypothetical protein QOZ80_8AG0625460 [Eleusine coracana subsp. coracana]|nr:hypothetical protein QOZ80_8AG0625460 [Eleusine coracana subsp. coracana]